MPAPRRPSRGARASPARAATRPVRPTARGHAAAHSARPRAHHQCPHRAAPPALSGRAARASARSTERGCTRTPNRSAITSTSSADRSDGSASRRAARERDDLLGQLVRPDAVPAEPAPVRPARPRPAQPPPHRTTGARTRTPAAACATGSPSTRARRTISYFTCTRSRGSKNSEPREPLVAHRLRPRVQAPLRPQPLDLRILTTPRHHASSQPLSDRLCRHLGRNRACSGAYRPNYQALLAPKPSIHPRLRQSYAAQSPLQLRHNPLYASLSRPPPPRPSSTSASRNRSTIRNAHRPPPSVTNGSGSAMSVHARGNDFCVPSSAKKNTRSSPHVCRAATNTNSRPSHG